MIACVLLGAVALSGCAGQAAETTTAPSTTTSPSTSTVPSTTTTTAAPWGPLGFEPGEQVFAATETVQIGLGDLDGDGDVDAVFANMGANDSAVFLNDGGGVFEEAGLPLTRQGHGAVVGDLDGDGDLDAVITCAHFGGGGGWSYLPSVVYLNDGHGVLSDSGQDLGDTRLSGVALQLLDIDGDGSLDLYIEYYDPAGMPDRVYLNDGRGRFADSGLLLDDDEIAWGDVDGDGDIDLFGKRYGEGYVVRLNDGSGRMEAGWRLDDGAAMEGGLVLVDADGDGDPDALVGNGNRSHHEAPTRLMINDGRGGFTDGGRDLDPTSYASFAVGDLDGDGDLDVYVANSDLPDEVWLADGTTLVDSGIRLTPSVERALTTRPSLADLDGDGDLDVFVGAFGGRAEIWVNQSLPFP